MGETGKPGRRCLRPVPCPAYDVEGMESWLSDMSARGLFLTEDGFFAGLGFFRRGKPRRLWYRLEASPEPLGLLADFQPDQEAEDLNRSFGWTYVASRGQFFIYSSPRPAERELHTDPRVQALALELVCRRQRGAVVSCLLWAILYPLLRVGRTPLLLLIGGGTWFVLWGALLLLWWLIGSAAALVHLTRLRRRLSAGGALDRRKNWQKRAALYRAVRVAVPVVTVLWLAVFLQKWSVSAAGEGEIPLADFAGEVPFATMADFAPEGRYALEDIGFANTVRFESDLLAPAVISWQEIADIHLPEGGTVSGSLYIDYLETRSPALAREAAEEYAAMGRREPGYEALEPPAAEADFAAAWRDYLSPSVVLQRGNIALKATFLQTGSETIPLDAWASILADSLHPTA